MEGFWKEKEKQQISACSDGWVEVARPTPRPPQGMVEVHRVHPPA